MDPVHRPPARILPLERESFLNLPERPLDESSLINLDGVAISWYCHWLTLLPITVGNRVVRVETDFGRKVGVVRLMVRK